MATVDGRRVMDYLKNQDMRMALIRACCSVPDVKNRDQGSVHLWFHAGEHQAVIHPETGL